MKKPERLLQETRRWLAKQEPRKPGTKDTLTTWNLLILSWMTDALDGELAKKRGERIEIIHDVHRFAFSMLVRELAARNLSFQDALDEPEAATFARRRLFEWALARWQWHLLLLRKECPDAGHSDAGIREGAFAGWLLSARKRESKNPAVAEFLSMARDASPAAYRAFTRWVSNPTPARWKYPGLDSWLTLIWTLLTEEKWSYRDVWLVACEKFEADELPPLETADALGAHCKLILRLRIQNPKAGRPLNDDELPQATRPPLAALALSIDGTLPADSLFVEMGK